VRCKRERQREFRGGRGRVNGVWHRDNRISGSHPDNRPDLGTDRKRGCAAIVYVRTETAMTSVPVTRTRSSCSRSSWQFLSMISSPQCLENAGRNLENGSLSGPNESRRTGNLRCYSRRYELGNDRYYHITDTGLFQLLPQALSPLQK